MIHPELPVQYSYPDNKVRGKLVKTIAESTIEELKLAGFNIFRLNTCSCDVTNRMNSGQTRLVFRDGCVEIYSIMAYYQAMRYSGLRPDPEACFEYVDPNFLDQLINKLARPRATSI